jgi:hypothetical protein
VSWDEAFASRYEEWSAHMTADVAFYVEQSAGAIVADLAGCAGEETLFSATPSLSGNRRQDRPALEIVE